MTNKHYDVAILGGSLTARIVAALLAKNGAKVLFLRNQEARAPLWFHSSLFLEKILGLMGGLSCFKTPEPTQVISGQSRLTISHNGAMEEELTREFGVSAPKIKHWLADLREHGNQLEETFWENGGLPWPALKATARFKLICMKRKINLNQFEVPVVEKLNTFSGAEKEFLVDLLQGFSLRSVDNLSYARAAILWAQVMRPENLAEPEFSEVMTKRFNQFHGARASLDDLDRLESDGNHWSGGTFKSGTRFSAKTFLLGDRSWLKLFNIEESQLRHSVYTPCAMKTTDLKGQLSPLLKKRVICGGKLPLRIAMEEENDELRGLVLTSPEADESSVRQQLEPTLPFSKFKMSIVNQPQAIKESEGYPAMSLPLTSIPLRISGNLYHADRTAALPEMGAAGAALLAWTLYTNLSDKTNPEKE